MGLLRLCIHTAIQYESASLRDTGLAHQRISLCKLTCQCSPFLPHIHSRLSQKVSFSLKRDLDLNVTTGIKIKQELAHPRGINYKPTYLETKSRTDTWFASGQLSAFTSASSYCDSHLAGEILSIFSCFSEAQMTIFLCMFMPEYFFFFLLSSPAFSFPLLPLFFFPYSVALSWIGILNVFQVSAQRCISYLRMELRQAAAPGASEPLNPTPTLLQCGPCPHWYTGNGCNLLNSQPVTDYSEIVMAE